MDRFGINNLIKPVSLEQFLEIGFCLEDSLKKIRKTTSSKLLLTMDHSDYIGPGSLTVITDESTEALNRRKQIQLSDLNKDLWNNSYNRELYINDNTSNDSYMISFSNEISSPKRLTFYGQYLDDKSKKIILAFKEFKKTTQRIDDGFHKTSNYALAHALRNLNKMSYM